MIVLINKANNEKSFFEKLGVFTYGRVRESGNYTFIWLYDIEIQHFSICFHLFYYVLSLISFSDKYFLINGL